MHAYQRLNVHAKQLRKARHVVRAPSSIHIHNHTTLKSTLLTLLAGQCMLIKSLKCTVSSRQNEACSEGQTLYKHVRHVKPMLADLIAGQRITLEKR